MTPDLIRPVDLAWELVRLGHRHQIRAVATDGAARVVGRLAAGRPVSATVVAVLSVTVFLAALVQGVSEIGCALIVAPVAELLAPDVAAGVSGRRRGHRCQ
ncbi:hypothetical protein [Corynebacterium kalidii]